MISYRCPCGTEYELPDNLAGNSVQCYKCNRIGTVSASTSAAIPAPPRLTELSGFGDLLSKSWLIYKDRFLTLFLCSIAAVVLICSSFLFAGLGLILPKKNIAIPAGMILTFFSFIYAAAWSSAAYTTAIASQKGVLDSFCESRSRALAVFWLGLLMGFLVLGAHLLLLIPGIIFTVWFFFAPFVVATESERGMDALLKSREYVRGRWWAVALQLFLVWLLTLGIASLPVAGQILALFIVPFSVIHSYLLFQELKSLRPGKPFQPSGKAKAGIWAVGLLGYVCIPAILFALAGTLLLGTFMQIKQKLKFGGGPSAMLVPVQAGASESAPSGATSKRLFTPLEIHEQIRSKNLPQNELVKLLGEPDWKGEYKGQELWQYYHLTLSDPAAEPDGSSKIWHQYFLFTGDRVTYDWVTDMPGPPKD